MARFVQLMSYKGFTCPANQFVATPYNNASWPTITMPSYCTAFIFLEIPNGQDGQTPPPQTAPPHNVGIGGGVCYWTTSGGENNPNGYVPTVSKVGNPAEKIFIADGGRYSHADSAVGTVEYFPDYDPSEAGSGGSTYADQGAFSNDSSSWDRFFAPGASSAAKPSSRTVDVRLYAYRHGSQVPYATSDQMRMNCGFYDGHVQTMGDLQSANPSYWMPRNSFCYPAGQVYTDVLKQYFGNHVASFSSPFIID
jgi:prepilin-type processing-associated H-X9-DG protein